jgi:adenylate kinase
MVNVVFLGAPGSGKGTQAALLSEDLNIPNISTGEILRREVEEKSEVGNLAKSYMESGGLVPDKVVVDIIKKRILEVDCKKGFILDGFPRNLKQAEIIDKMLEETAKKIDLVINIDVDFNVLVKRISGRFTCKKCGVVYNKFFNKPKSENICDKCQSAEFTSRSDDNEETVKNRLKVYNENTKELIEFYRKKDLIYSVNGLKDIALVKLDINKSVDSFINNKQ